MMREKRKISAWNCVLMNMCVNYQMKIPEIEFGSSSVLLQFFFGSSSARATEIHLDRGSWCTREE